MINIDLQNKVIEAIEKIYNEKVEQNLVQIQQTRKEFVGDFTLVVFPFVKLLKKSPEIIANEIGEYIKQNMSEVSNFNVIKGFLNFVLTDSFWNNFLLSNFNSNSLFEISKNNNSILIEYSSPNTNKPLHLGHIRNNLLGFSVAEILKANGNKVIKVNLINDRGIHICKSMIAWQKFGNDETPEKSELKGDFLVGKYYVKFDQEYKKQIAELISSSLTEDEAKQKAPIMLEAQEMLRKWEQNDAEVRNLWQKMNSWVYKGFDETYKKMGVDFDKLYYESETYLLGKEIVEKGLQNGTLYRKDDSSVWADLTGDGLDEKLLLRSDGTSVYMTQDIGTAILRHNEFEPSKMIYVVGNEQNYHFDVLKLILGKMQYSWSQNLFHLSYGMVELPEGKMKSREGTVVDADNLIDEMIQTAKEMSEELGKLQGLSDSEKEEVYRIIGLGALKYFLLKVDPKKNMTFNPKESIDFNGNTGPFIQYTGVRIKSIIRKAKENGIEIEKIKISTDFSLNAEKILLQNLYQFTNVVDEASRLLSPSIIANYTYELAKDFNQFYHENSILNADNEETRNSRLALTFLVGKTIENSLKLLGIEVPENYGGAGGSVWLIADKIDVNEMRIYRYREIRFWESDR